jgi:hypothetical protein
MILIFYWKRHKNPGFLLEKTRENVNPEPEIGNVYFGVTISIPAVRLPQRV